MSSLTSMDTIYLNSNPLISIDELSGINSLQNLYAQNCEIKYLPNNLFNIFNLNMSHNNLEDLFGIGSLGYSNSHWKFFDFSYNQIEVIPPEITSTITYVQYFSVKRNKLTHLPLELFDLSNFSDVLLDVSENLFSIQELNLIKETVRNNLPSIVVNY